MRRIAIPLAMFAVAWAVPVGCGAGQITTADHAMNAAEVGEQSACVEAYKPDVPRIELCRTQVRQRFDAYWHGYFGEDGGAE